MARIAEHYILAAEFVVFYLFSGAVSFLLLSVLFGRFCGLGLAAAWGGRSRFFVVAGPPGPLGCSAVLLLVLYFVALACGRRVCLRFVVGLGCFELSLRGRPVLHGFAHCFDGPADFAVFSGLRGARQVERFAACSFRHLPHVVFSPGG